MNLSRRHMLKISAGAIGLSWSASVTGFGNTLFSTSERSSAFDCARDEIYWQKIGALFDIDRSFINLENGYYGIMPAPIHRDYLENTLRVNRLNSLYLRTSYKPEMETIRKKLAVVLGVSHDEIVLTRGGTEALQNLITGYNKLAPGDEVMYANLDYYSCQYAFNWLQERRGARLFTVAIPEPASKQAVLDVYAQALDDHPRLKLFLLTHVNNRTGLVLPVREITEMARLRGVDVIVDAAHSWGQLNFSLADLRADFVGLSLHKWIHAPMGVGCIYIRKDRIVDIDPCMADELYASTDIQSRVHSGTKNIASFLTLPTALDLHTSVGPQAKEERLRYLRNHWVKKARGLDGIEVLTPDDDEMYCGITSFRVRGRMSKADNEAIANYLLAKHRIFTVQRTGAVNGDCIRVTPALFTTVDDVEKFSDALEDVVKNF